MSWIFGIAGNFFQNLNDFTGRYKPLFLYNSESLKIYAGGFNETLFTENISEEEGWIVSGIGIVKNNGKYKPADKDDWSGIVSKPELRNQVNGHFAAVKWKKDELQFFNDSLGFRDLFFLKTNNYLAFSTRIDFLKNATDNFEIDIKALSAYWLLRTPLSYNSLFKNILRLGPGGSARYFNNDLKISDNYFTPLVKESNSFEFKSTLEGLTTFFLDEKKKLALGLTGGLDSRVLLEYLLNQKNKKFLSYTFGKQESPDTIIAKQICKDKNIKHIFIETDDNMKKVQLKNLKEYSAQIGLNVPISRSIFYSFYKSLAKEDYIIIDGANGEIHRREFLNRLLYFHKKIIYQKNPTKFLQIFLRRKGDIFNQHLTKQLNDEIGGVIDDMFTSMPDPEEFTIENWLDLLMIRYSLSNNSGSSQGILDSFSKSYMPFAQQDLINIAFNLPLKEKKDGKLFKRILAESENHLDKFPRVKNNIIFPYNTSTITFRAISFYKKKFGNIFYDNWEDVFLNEMKEYIYDIINSSGFNSFELYETKKIKNNIEKFYAGDKSLKDYVNWWLTFEIWRETFFGKS